MVQYAHKFRSKVYVTLNTLLSDDQLPAVQKLIHQIYHAEADALIIQDMGILQLDIPPISLHASTQTDNRTVEKIRFLEQSGFSRVVLARELNLNQISEIASQTNVELEAFVHGALCVSYSGQCYISEASCGRSANRGECAQYCRLPYNLFDASGNILLKNKHLLSMKDLDLSESLEELIQAGIRSFKIEGRLKDENYVKNITAFYRKKLDVFLDGNSSYKKASTGKTVFFFEPNPAKSFRRGATDYFLHGRHAGIFQPETPKSIGEPIGKVMLVDQRYFEVENGSNLTNGDGLCYFDKQNELIGFRLNKIERSPESKFSTKGTKIKCYPSVMPRLQTGTLLYRNHDQAFEKIMNGKTAERKVNIDLSLTETERGFAIDIVDEDGIHSRFESISEKQMAQNTEIVESNIRRQLSKLGDSIYQIQNLQINLQEPWFFPATKLNEWRREAIDQLEAARKLDYKTQPREKPEMAHFPKKRLSYLANVTNKMAETFYRNHGVTEIEQGFEVKAQEGVPLMFTKHCIKYESGWCPKEGYKSPLNEPLYLKNNDQMFELTFDCKLCEMRISKKTT